MHAGIPRESDPPAARIDHRSAYRTASRDLAEGRQRLRKLGVLPWAVFDGAPPARWWETDELQAALRQWLQEAIDYPTLEIVTRTRALEEDDLRARQWARWVRRSAPASRQS